MGEVRICLFGRLQVNLDGQIAPAFDSHKTEELFCYLLIHRRCHHRELLASLVCNECPPPQSKKYLRQVIWRLQSALQERAPDFLIVDRDWVQFNPDVQLWTDVEVLERSFALAEGVAGEMLDLHHAQILRRAVDLYQGDLLEGWYEDWCLFERERLQNIYLDLLDKLMGYCETHGPYDSGLQYGERILKYDRASERTYQRLMRLHYFSGSRGAALRQYERCVSALQAELGVKPSRRSTQLYEQIRSDSLPGPAAAVTVPNPKGETAPGGDVLLRLQQFELMLQNVGAQVESEISALRMALGISS